ncbi:MAG: AAA family ATPase, partial [Tissierellia bacterium]|nr:AAA family ATPase [Tissierellia bacterium]
MHIKSYKTNRFAGLKNLDIEFEDGLNVILGPNESGKSTLIEGIYHTLFKEAKLTKNRKADKEFTNRFMPISKGDTIDGKLTIKYLDKEYEIYKSWGADTKAELVYDDGYIIRDENSIKKELEKIFDFGESTYSNIVFAKQKNLKKAINNIMENPDLSKEMTDVLRRTMMELDGVSIDLIEKNLIEEKEKLFNRWDIEKSYPQNNKGINDPYKVGLGTIIKSFYNKEGLKIQVKEAYEAEKNFEIIAEELNNVKKQKKIFEAEKENLDSIKDDINNREVFNYKLELLNKDEVELKEINENWPKYEMKISNIDEKIKFLEKNTEELEDKKKLSEKCDEKIKLKSKIETIEKIEEEIILLKEKLDKISIITDVDIDNLRKLENEMMKLETTMSAGKIIGIIKKDSGKEIYIKNDFEDRRLLDTDNFSAKGFVNIVYNDE